MKKYLLIISILISLATFSVAQTDSAKANEYKWEVSASINSVEAQIDQNVIDSWGLYPYSNLYYEGNKLNKSISTSITPKHLIKKDFLLRCEFGFTNIYIISHLNGANDSNATPSTQYLIKDDTMQQKIFRLIPGIQWNFIKAKFIRA